jgi:hypothetical protein
MIWYGRVVNIILLKLGTASIYESQYLFFMELDFYVALLKTKISISSIIFYSILSFWRQETLTVYTEIKGNVFIM